MPARAVRGCDYPPARMPTLLARARLGRPDQQPARPRPAPGRRGAAGAGRGGRGDGAGLRADGRRSPSASASRSRAIGRHRGGRSRRRPSAWPRGRRARRVGAPGAARAGASTSPSATARTTSRSPPRCCGSRARRCSTTSGRRSSTRSTAGWRRPSSCPRRSRPSACTATGPRQAAALPGLKEEYYLADFAPDRPCSTSSASTPAQPLAVVRTPPAVSLYHRFEHSLFADVLDRLREQGQVVVLPPRRPSSAPSWRGRAASPCPSGRSTRSRSSPSPTSWSARGHDEPRGRRARHAGLDDVRGPPRRRRRAADRRGAPTPARAGGRPRSREAPAGHDRARPPRPGAPRRPAVRAAQAGCHSSPLRTRSARSRHSDGQAPQLGRRARARQVARRSDLGRGDAAEAPHESSTPGSGRCGRGRPRAPRRAARPGRPSRRPRSRRAVGRSVRTELERRERDARRRSVCVSGAAARARSRSARERLDDRAGRRSIPKRSTFRPATRRAASISASACPCSGARP